MKEKKRIYIDIAAYVLIFCFTVAGIIVSLNRFWQYEVFYFDFGIFDQAIWKVSQFRAPIIEHFIVGGKWIFADHFNPSIFLLSPFYWLTTRNEILLVVQAVAVGLSGIVLYSIGKHVLRNKFLALSILACYFLFSGLQNAVITEFHELTVAMLPLMLTFWAILNKKLKLYLLFLIITLGFKESLFATGIGIGIALFFLRKEWRHLAAPRTPVHRRIYLQTVRSSQSFCRSRWGQRRILLEARQSKPFREPYLDEHADHEVQFLENQRVLLSYNFSPVDSKILQIVAVKLYNIRGIYLSCHFLECFFRISNEKNIADIISPS